MNDGVRLILASASPRRRELLGRMVPDFEIDVSGVDEDGIAGPPSAVALALAVLKSAAVACRHATGWVLGADTVIDLQGELLGKPAGPKQAAEMLRRLSGREHRVLTALSLQPAGPYTAALTGLVATSVRFRELSEVEVDAYVAGGEPLDKAGAYAIQGQAGAWVTGVEGCYNNVVGLPLCGVVRLFAEAGLGDWVRCPRCDDPWGRHCGDPAHGGAEHMFGGETS